MWRKDDLSGKIHNDFRWQLYYPENWLSSISYRSVDIAVRIFYNTLNMICNKKILITATKFLTRKRCLTIMIIELSVIRLS